MNQQEAEALCAKFAAEHADRETHRWIAKQTDDGEWAVVKIGLPPAEKLTLKTSSGEEGPGQVRDDPRSAQMQDVPPYGVG
ncbi:MAG: hypothetical protein ACR2N5_02830 [Solirubrobacterales bacterium]